MRKKTKIDKIKLIPALSLLLILLAGFFGGIQYQKYFGPTQVAEAQFPEEATVARVVDGDTIELSNGQHLRYVGVNAPDANNLFYEEATEFNKNLVEGKKIKLEYDKYKNDKFGRILAYVFVDDKNVNVELTRNGLAEVKIYQKRAKLIYQDELLEAQEQAKKEKLGIWSD